LSHKTSRLQSISAAGDPAVIIELEVDSTAPIQGRSELTPGPEQIQTEQISQASVAQQQVVERTQKEEEASPPKVDIATAPDPEVMLPDVREVPDIKPDEEKQKEKDTEKQQQNPSEAHIESALTSAPQAEPVVAPQMTVSAGAAVDDTVVVITWRARLSAHVQRFKRYPAEALEKHLHGTAVSELTWLNLFGINPNKQTRRSVQKKTKDCAEPLCYGPCWGRLLSFLGAVL
jgi:protein TonB